MPGVSSRVICSTQLESGNAVSRAYVSRSERKIDARHCSWYMPGIVRHQPLESVSRAWFTPRRGSVRPRCGQAVQNRRTRREHTGLCSRLRRGDQLWMLRTGLHGPWMIFGHGHCDDFATLHRFPGGGVFSGRHGPSVRRSHCWGRPEARRFNLVGFSVAVHRCGELLIPPLNPLLFGRVRIRSAEPGGPPLFVPSLKFQGDDTHNNSRLLVVSVFQPTAAFCSPGAGTNMSRV